eukprot:3030539-Pleurochrysis_carterae.AAC.1
MSEVETSDETLARLHFGPTVDGLSAWLFARQILDVVTFCSFHPSRTHHACLPFSRLFRCVWCRFIFILDDLSNTAHTDRAPTLDKATERASKNA